MSKYVIIDAEAIQKRIEELENDLKDEPNPFINTSYQAELDVLNKVLFKSTPLIPEIEKAFDAGVHEDYLDTIGKEDYISNLKLDI
jgi:hypothetical protein